MNQSAKPSKTSFLIPGLIIGLVFWGGLFWFHAHTVAADRAKAQQVAVAQYQARKAREASGEVMPSRFAAAECTDDCSGHEAGYAWAEENSITASEECTGNSDSFIEGCVAWVEDTQ